MEIYVRGLDSYRERNENTSFDPFSHMHADTIKNRRGGARQGFEIYVNLSSTTS